MKSCLSILVFLSTLFHRTDKIACNSVLTVFVVGHMTHTYVCKIISFHLHTHVVCPCCGVGRVPGVPAGGPPAAPAVTVKRLPVHARVACMARDLARAKSGFHHPTRFLTATLR